MFMAVCGSVVVEAGSSSGAQMPEEEVAGHGAGFVVRVVFGGRLLWP
jgi:hypothetical protein